MFREFFNLVKFRNFSHFNFSMRVTHDLQSLKKTQRNIFIYDTFFFSFWWSSFKKLLLNIGTEGFPYDHTCGEGIIFWPWKNMKAIRRQRSFVAYSVLLPCTGFEFKDAPDQLHARVWGVVELLVMQLLVFMLKKKVWSKSHYEAYYFITITFHNSLNWTLACFLIRLIC